MTVNGLGGPPSGGKVPQRPSQEFRDKLEVVGLGGVLAEFDDLTEPIS